MVCADVCNCSCRSGGLGPHLAFQLALSLGTTASKTLVTQARCPLCSNIIVKTIRPQHSAVAPRQVCSFHLLLYAKSQQQARAFSV